MSVKSSPVIVLDQPPPDKWESEDEFEARLNRIQSKASSTASEVPGQLDSDAVARLKAENAQLKQLSEEARRRISQLQEEALKVTKRDADIDKMLEEKSEQIRQLEEKLAKLEAKQSSGVSEEELIALHGELERERQTLDDDRQSMEEQFRQLELSMARERAEIARERNELQRTKTELKLKQDTIDKHTQAERSPLQQLREDLHADPSQPMAASGMPMPTLPALNRRAPEDEITPRRSGIISRFLGKRND